ncbi:MAG: 2-oxoacid:acceptor oxidoreductase family protein [Thermoplasmata archaeon]|nr:2-oxoacid:acceptor oxidoreductase family protein [Thermoplasmata archaeon]
MKEIIFYGRGGQGAVTAANLIASAALKSGNKGVQAFPFFGAERRGAPVKAFARISDEEIYLRSQIREPDIVVVLDTGIMDAVDISQGLKESGMILLNTNKKPSDFSLPYKVATVDATSIAIKNEILVGGIPVVNTPMTGALVKILDGVKLEALKEAIVERFGKYGEKNAKAAEEAYEKVIL